MMREARSSPNTERTPSSVLVFGLIALALSSGCSDPVAPLIEGVLPVAGASGALVDIVGERFAGSERAVAFGGVNAATIGWWERRIQARVPEGLSGQTVVVVTVDGRPSNPFDFLVTSPAPAPDGG